MSISTNEIKEAIFNGDIIEEYPDDSRGASCLVYHSGEKRILHVVCSPKSEYLAIITAYIPALEQWSSDLKTRR